MNIYRSALKLICQANGAKRLVLAGAVFSGALSAGCGTHDEPAASSFEEFRLNTPYSEELKRYFVEDDIAMDEVGLRSYYDRHFPTEARAPQSTSEPNLGSASSALLQYSVPSGGDVKWTSGQAMNLTYCVNPGFGGDTNNVINAMAGANLAWANAAMVNFVHLAAEDSNCQTSNNNVVFIVRPFDFGGSPAALSFFPNAPKAMRELLVDRVAITSGLLQTVLTHELGHILGFRHENNRVGPNPRAGSTCGWEDSSFRALTDQDPMSIMNCSGASNLFMTFADQSGAACEYGAAPGFTPAPCGAHGLLYHSNVQGIGWTPIERDNDITGTIGQSLRLEAFRVLISGLTAPAPSGICYTAHVQNVGWQPEVCNFQTAGTIGQGLRAEAVKFRLLNPPANCSVVYQAHVQSQGWQSPVMDNAVAGTTGQSLRLEALKIGLTPGCIFF